MTTEDQKLDKLIFLYDFQDRMTCYVNSANL